MKLSKFASSLFLALSATTTLAQSSASEQVDVYYPRMPFADITYDCPGTLGWMTVRVTSHAMYQRSWDRVTRQTANFNVWTGSLTACDQQRDLLNANRRHILHPQLIAFCSPGHSYLLRYSIDELGATKKVSSDYYGDYNRCMDAARITNAG